MFSIPGTSRLANKRLTIPITILNHTVRSSWVVKNLFDPGHQHQAVNDLSEMASLLKRAEAGPRWTVSTLLAFNKPLFWRIVSDPSRQHHLVKIQHSPI